VHGGKELILLSPITLEGKRTSMALLDRELQKKILESLRKVYPEAGDVSSFLDVSDQKHQANLFYLEEHGLIESGVVRNAMNVPRQMLTARITANGLDFLEDDGGLGAILNVVTVKMDAESIKAILENRIRASDLPAVTKETAIQKIKSFSGDVLKSVIVKLIEKGIEKPEQIAALIDAISKIG
jgi:hypothetical protein